MILKVPTLFKTARKHDLNNLLKLQNFTPYFKNISISKEDIGYILNSVKFGIKRESQQPLTFVFIEDPNTREFLKNKFNQNLFITAPVVICVLGSFKPKAEELDSEKRQHFLWFQLGSAITTMCLAAANKDLGVWFEETPQYQEEIKNILNADAKKDYLLGFCFIGKPELKNKKSRIFKEPSVFFDRYNNTKRKNKSEYFKSS